METEKSKEIVLLEKKVNKIAEDVLAIRIVDDESMLDAADKRKQIKQYLSDAVKAKKEATDPLNGVLKTIRGWFAPIEEKAENSIGHIEGLMSKYNREVEQKRLKAEREAQEKIDKANAELEKGKISEKQAEKVIERAEAKVEKAPEVIKKSESFHTRKIKKMRILNTELIPKQYWIIDEVALRRDVISGVVVPGTELYEEESFV